MGEGDCSGRSGGGGEGGGTAVDIGRGLEQTDFGHRANKPCLANFRSGLLSRYKSEMVPASENTGAFPGRRSKCAGVNFADFGSIDPNKLVPFRDVGSGDRRIVARHFSGFVCC